MVIMGVLHPPLVGECMTMRCLACGTAMILTNVVQDDSMAVLGFEHHIFRCSQCHKVERRLVFTKHGREITEAMPTHVAPPIVPASTMPDARTAAPGFFRRMAEKVRGR
jgi:hypothetical protein